MIGDRRGDLRVRALVEPVLQRTRQRQVQLGPLAGEQVVLDDLAQERVAEPVDAIVLNDHDVTVDGLAQRVAQGPRLEPARLLEQRMVEQLADGDEPQQLRAGSDSRSTRSISASRSVSGAAPRPSSPAASSSSPNSGLPPERAHSRSSRSAAGGAPRMSVSCSASSSRVSGPSRTRRARGRSSSSASSERSGWLRCSSSGR